MGDSAWIFVTFLLISAVTAIPAGDGKAVLNIVETMGPWGSDAKRLVKELSGRLAAISGDQKSGTYLGQRISLAIQRGNVASFLGTLPADGDLEDDTHDLNAESSEIISEAVAPPPGVAQKYQEPAVAASEVHAGPDHSIELVGGSQTFFPSFANLFEPRPQNSFRIGYNNQEEGAYSQRPNSYRSLLNYPLFGGYRNLENFGKQSTPTAAPIVDASSSVLGSGNFGIIRGGTFLAQNDEDDFEGDDFNYYNNGHGRPSYDVGYIANPRPNYNQDQFANFRDFADINAPSNSAYSHYVVVYANKNGTMDEISEETRNVVTKPKNIFEALERIDKTSTTRAPKLSKSKAKLQLTKQKMLSKKEQWKKTNSKYVSPKHDPEEPLLALS